MSKQIIAAIVVVLVLLATGAFLLTRNPTNTNTTQEDTQAMDDNMSMDDNPVSSPEMDMMESGNASVTIQNLAFRSSDLSISVGTTVTWTNDDLVPHTVTADDGSFDSGVINSGETFSHTFDTVGTLDYHCSIHGMTGVVKVQ